LTYRFPILLDAATAAVQRKGDQMLLKWADIMTGNTYDFIPFLKLICLISVISVLSCNFANVKAKVQGKSV
jgi:hypothetical protein